jgi:hypothetical protein
MTPAAHRRPLRSTLALALALLAALVLVAATAWSTPTKASAATRTPPVPAALPTNLEPLAAYVPANSCDPTVKPGTDALGRLLTATYPHTSYLITRTCGVDPLPTSEHYDGRAVDWMNSVRNPTQAAQAKAVIGWLFATDSSGHAYANARRLGVMYVIWDNRIWGAYSADRGWRPYSSCAAHPEKNWDTTCHRDHMHLSLSWAGAMKRTSFWSGQVAATDFGPCRAADLNWAAPYRHANPTPCPRYPAVTAPKGASSTLRTLTTYSGMRLTPGSRGPAVSAVQRALRMGATGYFGTATRAAVQRFQTSQALSPTGNVNTPTWRALLRVNAG